MIGQIYKQQVYERRNNTCITFKEPLHGPINNVVTNNLITMLETNNHQKYRRKDNIDINT